MSEHLMSAADLERVTGKKRYSKQAAWFKAQFGIDVVRAADGKLVMTWARFDALLARQSGTETAVKAEPARPEICSPFA